MVEVVTFSTNYVADTEELPEPCPWLTDVNPNLVSQVVKKNYEPLLVFRL